MPKFVVRCAYEITCYREIAVDAEDARRAGAAAIRLAEIEGYGANEWDITERDGPIYIDAICDGDDPKALDTKPIPLATLVVGASKPKP